mgnify:CR=1 FL=1
MRQPYHPPNKGKGRSHTTPRQQAEFIARVQAGETPGSVARATGWSYRTVWDVVERARQRNPDFGFDQANAVAELTELYAHGERLAAQIVNLALERLMEAVEAGAAVTAQDMVLINGIATSRGKVRSYWQKLMENADWRGAMERSGVDVATVYQQVVTLVRESRAKAQAGKQLPPPEPE